jgi:putative oxidoreductase
MGSIDAYALLPAWAVVSAALTMPGIELALGLALLVGVQVRPAALLANLLMLAFIAAIGSAMRRGLELDCGCFDLLPIGPSEVGWGTIGRDALMMLPTLWLAFWEAPKTR